MQWQGNGLKLKEGRFRLGIRKKVFTVEVVRHWDRLSRVMPHPWKRSRPSWMEFQAFWFSVQCPCPSQGVRTRWCLTGLWLFHDSVAFYYDLLLSWKTIYFFKLIIVIYERNFGPFSSYITKFSQYFRHHPTGTVMEWVKLRLYLLSLLHAGFLCTWEFGRPAYLCPSSLHRYS